MNKKQALFLIFWTLNSTLAWAGTDFFVFSSAVPKKHKQTINRDLLVLKNLDFTGIEPDHHTKRILGLETLDAQSLEDWLGDRVKVIVNEEAYKFFKIPFNNKIKVEKDNVDYPNPGLPIAYGMQSTPENESEESSSYTVMTNIGAAIYLDGKKEKKVYNVNISSGLFHSEKITIDSPRVGIIQIGPGLFDRRFNINNTNPAAVSNTLHRLSVLFHEARHSDGHGESLAFVHVPCPKGHDYEGLLACDEVPNGAYGVGATVVNELFKTCNDELCTEREREIMRLIILESKNRILNKSYKGLSPKSYDARPETLE